MKTNDLPLSDNVEDRRERPAKKLTFKEQLERGEQYKPNPTSPLARDAGADDVKG